MTEHCAAMPTSGAVPSGSPTSSVADTDPQRPDRHPGRSGPAHGRQPAAGLCPQAGPGAGDLAGLSRHDRAVSAIDYRLTDPYLDPPGLFDAFYSEESIRLPDTFWCYDPLTDQAAGQCPSRLGERLHHLWLLEQLLQGQRRLSGAVGAGAAGGAAVASAAAGPTGPGTGACVGQARARRDCCAARGVCRQATTAGVFEAVPAD